MGQHIYGFLLTPNSERVVYLTSRNGDRYYDLHSVGTDGTDRTLLATSVLPEIQISPNNEFVSFQSGTCSDRNSVNTVSIYGGLESNLTPGLPPGMHIYNGWFTPDSQQVLFNGNLDDKGQFDLYRAPVTGGNISRINGPSSGGHYVSIQFAKSDWYVQC